MDAGGLMTKTSRLWIPVAATTAMLGVAYASGVLAETIVVNDQVSVRQTEIPRPKRGMSMAEVQKSFGEPRERHPTVGTPPITRWDYEHFAVFFEKDLVIDAVVPGDTSPPSAAPIPATTPASPPASHDGEAPQSSDTPLTNVGLHP
jgi:hypothetical protein